MIDRIFNINNYHFRVGMIILILCGLSYLALQQFNATNDSTVAVRIDLVNNHQRLFLKHYIGDDHDFTSKSYFETKVNWKQFFFLQNNGLNPAIQVSLDRDELVDPYFHTFVEIAELIQSYEDEYPQIVTVEKIGEGSSNKLSIWGLKISDNPDNDEAEPAVLFSAGHHAKELLGVEVCLYLIDYLCKNYDKLAEVQHWVDNIEIWIVPVINPDGYQHVMDSPLPLQFWRKNLRDNNSDAKFDPDIDGVDLNRNYDFNWDADGSADPRSWYYRGAYPFSESETRVIRDLTSRENFIFHLDFHSYGEAILYPWENFTCPADFKLVLELAQEMARQINKRAELTHYAIRSLNGSLGQCSVWMHGKAGVYSYIVEVGDSHFPPGHEIPQILKENAAAAFYVMNRIFKSAISGVIKNAYDNTPIQAAIDILEYASPIIATPVSDGNSGYYHRLAQPGLYTVKFSAAGFRTKIIHSVRVEANAVTTLNIALYPIEETLPTEN